MVRISCLVKPLLEKSLESFEWIRREKSVVSKIPVVSGKVRIYDNYSEWMSAMTGRVSVSTVQGYEWLPGFSNKISPHNNFQYEHPKGMDSPIKWMDQNDVHADFLILPKWENVDACNWTSEPTLHWIDALLFPGVKSVFENDDVLIMDLKNTDIRDLIDVK